MRQVYLDYASAMPLEPEIYTAMRPWLTKKFANPSALYASAVEARGAVEAARQKVADVLFTQPETIVFTGSGTESTNLALLGVGRSPKSIVRSPKHLITTRIEHHSVLQPIRQLEKDGWRVTYLPVDREGKIDLDDFRKTLGKETLLVSIQYANNEIGAIQPLADIGREILKWRKARGTPYPYFHTDACQAAAYLELNVEKLHVDLMSLNGSKIYGPKGVGILYKRRGVAIEPLMYGGGQEFGLRPGTENVAGIVGLAEALDLTCNLKHVTCNKVAKLRNYFWKKLQERITGCTLNGPMIRNLKFKTENLKFNRLPNNLNISFKDVDAEALILYLDAAGIQCSSQSACSTDSDEVSHVLLACGLSAEEAKISVRFTLGRETRKKDIDYVMARLPDIVKKIRLTA